MTRIELYGVEFEFVSDSEDDDGTWRSDAEVDNLVAMLNDFTTNVFRRRVGPHTLDRSHALAKLVADEFGGRVLTEETVAPTKEGNDY